MTKLLKTSSSSHNVSTFYLSWHLKLKTSLVGSRSSHLDACTFIEHAHPSYQHIILWVSLTHWAKFKPKSYAWILHECVFSFLLQANNSHLIQLALCTLTLLQTSMCSLVPTTKANKSHITQLGFYTTNDNQINIRLKYKYIFICSLDLTISKQYSMII